MAMKGHRSVSSALPSALILLLLLLLAACGVTTNVTGNGQAGVLSGTATTGSAASQTPSAQGTITRLGTPTPFTSTTGCPLPAQTVQWPSAPTVIVTAAEAAKGASLQVGQSLELVLPFGRHWTLGLSSTWEAFLTLDSPAGYGDASLKGCVWRFTAKNSGQAAISFTFGPDCKPPMECPQYLGILKVVITVS